MPLVGGLGQLVLPAVRCQAPLKWGDAGHVETTRPRDAGTPSQQVKLESAEASYLC